MLGVPNEAPVIIGDQVRRKQLHRAKQMYRDIASVDDPNALNANRLSVDEVSIGAEIDGFCGENLRRLALQTLKNRCSESLVHGMVHRDDFELVPMTKLRNKKVPAVGDSLLDPGRIVLEAGHLVAG